MDGNCYTRSREDEGDAGKHTTDDGGNEMGTVPSAEEEPDRRKMLYEQRTTATIYITSLFGNDKRKAAAARVKRTRQLRPPSF